jgi:hypothetical protein
MSLINLFSMRRYEVDYFQSLLAQHDAQEPVDRVEIESRIAELRSKTKPDGAAVCELELLVLRLQGHEDLVESLPTLRKRYSDATGQATPAAVTDQRGDAALLGEAMYLTIHIHRAYCLNRQFEKARQRIVVLMFVAAVLVVVLFRGMKAYRGLPTTVVDMVMVAGVLGGFTSCLRRVYTMTRSVDPISAIQSLTASYASMIAAPALGCVFAIAMHLCLVGGLVSGALFPSLSLEDAGQGAHMHFTDFLYGTVVGTSADFAKLLVWSFIAGFAERLLPDLLDTFSSKAKSKASQDAR